MSANTYGTLCDADYRRVRLSNEADPFETAIMIQGDNKAALQTAKNPVNHKRMKHIHIAFGLTREAVQAKYVAPCYVSTTDNTADIMTKELGTVLHRHHADAMIVEYSGGKYFNTGGKEITIEKQAVTKDDLYKDAAPGLEKVSKIATDELLRVCQDLRLVQSLVDPPGEKIRDKGLGLSQVMDVARRVRQKKPVKEKPKLDVKRVIQVAREAIGRARARACREETKEVSGTHSLGSAEVRSAAAAAEARSGPRGAVHVACQAILSALGELARRIASKERSGTGRCNGRLAALSAALEDWAERCIIDSGASFTYATRRVPLTNVRPGTGSVTVATGKREPIAEIGDLGALKNVRRVNSFTRTLVSVRDLVEQFHRVIFDADGVSVESPDGGIRTLIGRPMRNRLYSYDGDALSQHAVAVQAC